MIKKKILCIIMSVILILTGTQALFAGAVNEDDSQKQYPFIFVHGLFGWGEDEGINNVVPYWGSISCNLVDELNNEGYDCYDASVGPFSSNWDRACELYAQITGTTVDYGEAHSKANGHLRYGRTYTNALVPNWGSMDESSKINKINLIGHSFGGNTIRLLAQLMQNGDKDEIEATDSNDISPLFTGGKGNYINSLTTICAPNNGSSAYYLLSNIDINITARTICYLYAGLASKTVLNGFVDFHLEQFGLTSVPGEKNSTTLFKTIKFMLSQQKDNAFVDLSPDAVEDFNEKTSLDDNTYYFSYSFCTTKPSKHGIVEIASLHTLPILLLSANLMGMYRYNLKTSYQIDKSWLPNDGLVNVVSARYPFGDKWTEFNSNDIQSGIWNVMPTRTGDHGTAIGMQLSKEETMSYYNEMIEMLSSLPEKE